MRSFAEIRDDISRGVLQAVENAKYELSRARQTKAGHQNERDTLGVALREATGRHRALESPQASVKAEIGDLEKRIQDLQRQMEGKREQLRNIESDAETIAEDLRKRRKELAELDRALDRDERETATKEAHLRDATGRLAESRLRALVIYSSEAFDTLRKNATEASSKEKYDKIRADFEVARHTDREVMSAHEERLELKALLDTTQLEAVRDLLLQRLRAVEEKLSVRFPGLLDAQPPPEDEEILEAFFWYDSEADLTRLVLPLPASCWITPPADLGDRRGEMLCRVLWAFVQGLGQTVPSVEFERDLVVLELHGDHSGRVAEVFFEIRISASRKATFMPTPLPPELAEVLG
jgi:hypothetical protein